MIVKMPFTSQPYRKLSLLFLMPFSVFPEVDSSCFFLNWWHFCTLGKLGWNKDYKKVSGVRLPCFSPSAPSY